MNKKITEFYVYNSMITFLYAYEKKRYGHGTLQEIIRELSPLPGGGTSNPAIWEEWSCWVNKSLEVTLETPSGEAADRLYTKLQAFDAMVDFFVAYCKRTLSGDLRVLMEVIVTLSEDGTDQKSWNDWNNAARKALQKEIVKKPIDETAERRLTKILALNALINFLQDYYKETSSDFMAGTVSSFYFTYDGRIVDDAFWQDWDSAIENIPFEQWNKKEIHDKIVGISVTESQAFKAMVQIFKYYFRDSPKDPDGIMLFDYFHLSPDGNSSSPIIRAKWKKFVDIALKEKPGELKYVFPVKREENG